MIGGTLLLVHNNRVNLSLYIYRYFYNIYLIIVSAFNRYYNNYHKNSIIRSNLVPKSYTVVGQSKRVLNISMVLLEKYNLIEALKNKIATQTYQYEIVCF